MGESDLSASKKSVYAIDLEQLCKAAEQLPPSEPLMSLFAGEAEDKAEQHRNRLKRVWKDLMLLIALVRDWSLGRWRNIPWHNLIVAASALVYFLNPFDLTPDFIFVLGYVDDAIVITAFASAIRADLERYRRWHSARRHAGSRPA